VSPAMSDLVASAHLTGAATGDAMGNDQQGLFYGHSRGTAWYAGVRYRYGSS
jgi:hypothetical protein